jgi:hypothetical protein
MTEETASRRIGQGHERNLYAGPFQPMVSSFELHLRAEKKSLKTIRTYLEAAQWLAAGHLIPNGITDWADVRARAVEILPLHSLVLARGWHDAAPRCELSARPRTGRPPQVASVIYDCACTLLYILCTELALKC